MTTTNDPPSTNGPCRVLLKTETQLVQGDEYEDKLAFLQNTLAVAHFGRKLDRTQDRWHIFGDHFALPNRYCYMLIDHGVTEAPEDLPISQYHLTREGSLVQELPSEQVLHELGRLPFNRPVRTRMPPGWSPSPRHLRALAKAQLRRGQSVTIEVVEFLQENPGEWEELQNSFSATEKAQLAETLECLHAEAFECLHKTLMPST